MLMNNNLMPSFQTSSHMTTNKMGNNNIITGTTGQLNLGATMNNNGTIMNASNVLSNNTTTTATTTNNVQTPVIGRPLFPDGQSGLLPNVTHTPLIADAMKAYNSIFPQQAQQQMLSLNTGGNMENSTNEINNINSIKRSGSNKRLEMGMSALTESFSDLKMDVSSGQGGVGQVIPTLVTTSSHVLPLEALSSVPSIPDGLIRGESAVSAVSEGNAHFVPYFPDDTQVSDGGLGASPTSAPTAGPSLQFTLPMGQAMNLNNGGGNMINNNTLLNGMPTVSGFPMTTILSYDTGSNDMSALETPSLPKSYLPEYWMQQSFTIPVSQYVPMNFNVNANGMYPNETSNLYNMNSYVPSDQGAPSQMGMGDYSMLSGQENEGQPTSNMGRRRQKQGDGRQRSTNRSSRRGRNMTPTNNMMNDSERSMTKGDNRQVHNESSEVTTTFERDNVSLMDLVKNELIEKCARDQHGSRYIQRALETATLAEKSAVFKQIEKCALGLCEDVFGNYVIQKFFEHGTDNHKITLAKILVGRVLPLTKSMYGCRVIQKALECVEEKLRIALVSELDGHVEECVRDQNGNHVIQKAIEEVSPEHLDFIVKTFHGKVYDFSTHPYGCRVIQRLLERCTLEQKEPLLNEILKQVSTLSKDQYGNYVVQHMLQHGTPKVRSAIIEIVATNIVTFELNNQQMNPTTTKNNLDFVLFVSSNVVEKLFTHSTEEEKKPF
ncbi:RNA binding protein [Reticulomyxa filosa]|uniref:RNA binding protein n=1 Tax=Reticulomyxa filosa TaxID=46433 RepID=X6NVZ3_RETFI|nr:RNA binding protein [Reticulomyxa filosa]|eukprot:ETO29994.1 RNA binding protein [Reticulomyxa filosa]